MENTCTHMADSCQCMAKPIQYCKVKNNNNKKRTCLLIFIHIFSCHIWNIIEKKQIIVCGQVMKEEII